MACSVTEGRSHDKGKGGRSVTGVHWGTKQKCNWEHGNVMSGNEKLMGGGTRLPGLLQCTLWHLNMASLVY